MRYIVRWSVVHGRWAVDDEKKDKVETYWNTLDEAKARVEFLNSF